MEGTFDRDALDRILFHEFRGDMPDMAAAWKILRRWMLGHEIFQLLMEGGRLTHAGEECATWTRTEGSRITVYPEGAWEMEDGVARHGWRLLMQVLSKTWRA